MVKSTANYKGRVLKLKKQEQEQLIKDLANMQHIQESKELIASRYKISLRTLDRYVTRYKEQNIQQME
jgi:DNA invertase Pin-like site-specific DNA recombinase